MSVTERTRMDIDTTFNSIIFGITKDLPERGIVTKTGTKELLGIPKGATQKAAEFALIGEPIVAKARRTYKEPVKELTALPSELLVGTAQSLMPKSTKVEHLTEAGVSAAILGFGSKGSFKIKAPFRTKFKPEVSFVTDSVGQVRGRNFVTGGTGTAIVREPSFFGAIKETTYAGLTKTTSRKVTVSKNIPGARVILGDDFYKTKGGFVDIITGQPIAAGKSLSRVVKTIPKGTQTPYGFAKADLGLAKALGFTVKGTDFSKVNLFKTSSIIKTTGKGRVSKAVTQGLLDTGTKVKAASRVRVIDKLPDVPDFIGGQILKKASTKAAQTQSISDLAMAKQIARTFIRPTPKVRVKPPILPTKGGRGKTRQAPRGLSTETRGFQGLGSVLGTAPKQATRGRSVLSQNIFTKVKIKPKTKQRSSERQIIREMLGQSEKQLTATRTTNFLFQKVAQRTNTRQRLRLRQITGTKLKTPTPTTPRIVIFGPPTPIIGTPIPPSPVLPFITGGGGRSGRKRRARRKRRQATPTPSLGGIFLGIKAKRKSAKATGFGIRPIPITGKSKKKRRKKPFWF